VPKLFLKITSARGDKSQIQTVGFGIAADVKGHGLGATTVQ